MRRCGSFHQHCVAFFFLFFFFVILYRLILFLSTQHFLPDGGLGLSTLLYILLPSGKSFFSLSAEQNNFYLIRPVYVWLLVELSHSRALWLSIAPQFFDGGLLVVDDGGFIATRGNSTTRYSIRCWSYYVLPLCGFIHRS